nr:MAG TPA: tail assembly chaperone protein [Caudoviricetes sp.]
MQIETAINGRVYRYMRLNAFDAHKLVLQLVKTIGPALSSVSMDSDVTALIGKLTEIGDPVQDIALPMWQKAAMTCDGKPLRSEADVNALFTAEDISDLYELAVISIKEQVGPAFEKALTRFGARS